jgi:hypothetical protein
MVKEKNEEGTNEVKDLSTKGYSSTQIINWS